MAANVFQTINKAALAEVRTHKKFFIVTNILLATGALMYALMSGFYSQYDYLDQLENQVAEGFSPSWFGFALIAAGSLMGIFGAVGIFRDMTNQQICDVQHSLPMSANQRYFSKLLAMCYSHILPVIVYTGIAMLYGGILCATHGVDGSVNLQIFMGALTAALFTDAITIVCTCCCGAFAESIYFTVIMMFCTSVLPIFIFHLLVENFAGLDMFDIPHFVGIWTYSFVALAEDSSFIFYTVINSLVSVAVMAATVFIYRRRDASSVGAPIVSRFFFELLLVMGVFTVYSMVLFNLDGVYGLVVVAIIYIVIHIIVTRAKLTLRSFMVWLLKYAATSAVFVIFMGIAYVTNGFGLVKSLPMRNLDKALLDISVYYNENGEYQRFEFVSYDCEKWAEIHRNEKNLSEELLDLSTLSDAQIREASRLIQDAYVSKPKSFDDYLHMLWNGDFYSRVNYDDTHDVYLSISTVESTAGDPDHAYDFKNGVKYCEYIRHSQTMTFSNEECKELAQKLRDLGYLNEINLNDVVID
ncbi:hypothetical protein SAMN02910447_02194 [Ruminococcus sp. YE71]|uniref:hypothetical protein n=1 Tax=unclassified Ruminococcus TaxID=2608920 RepID=UPI000888CCF8|nr:MULTISPECIES: hypothetical protein [unclassified Ruminococcus]SDA22639.1 hypothetical protein SAMN02910446_02062 [Ruminococcus sp. YE78]SFW38511.1 hypothetical protein SAMN02910447_02194 [Ruminococcus sp. YE71]